MDYFNTYVENLPDLYNCGICLIPTISYFISVEVYSFFHNKILEPKKEDIYYCNRLISTIIPANLFLIFPTFNEYNNIETLKFYNIIFGMIVIDTLQYFCHYIYHINPRLFSKLHSEHHSSKIINPRHAFLNNNIAAVEDSLLIFLTLLLLNISFMEYIIISSLSIISTVCDHVNTNPRKFHYIHHHVNKKKNLQQPFFTFWDHIFGTYYSNSNMKIPFIP